jgi:hypothetical protein
VHPAHPRKDRLEVAIFSSNVETLDGLQAYLDAAGLIARVGRRLEDLARLATHHLAACVVFPDDFPWEAVVSLIAELDERHPRALAILVTSHPKRLVDRRSGARTLVVPRPAWGWAILDAIRQHGSEGASLVADT